MGESVETYQHCHSDRSVSGVEESTTLEKEPPQDKICNSGRFLDSHSFARNDMSVGSSGCPQELYSERPPERHIGRSLRFRWKVLPLRPLFLQCRAWYRASSTVYGGPPSPKGKVMGVIPFNRTGCIPNVAGDIIAAPTGVIPFNPRNLKTDTSVAQIIVNYSSVQQKPACPVHPSTRQAGFFLDLRQQQLVVGFVGAGGFAE